MEKNVGGKYCVECLIHFQNTSCNFGFRIISVGITNIISKESNPKKRKTIRCEPEKGITLFFSYDEVFAIGSTNRHLTNFKQHIIINKTFVSKNLGLEMKRTHLKNLFTK